MPYGTYYKPGDWNVIDDFSGFRLKHSQVRRIPGGQTGGMLVARERWENQHPQDFVRGEPDSQVVPETRPRQPNRFTVVASFVTAFSDRLTRAVTVADTSGFNVNDRVAVMLDNGENYYPTVIGIIGNQLLLTPVLPYTVGGNIGDPIENTVLRLGASDLPPFIANDANQAPIVDNLGDLLSGNR